MTPAEIKSNIPIICLFTFSFTVQLTKESVIGYKGSYDMFITFMKNKNIFQYMASKLDGRLCFGFFIEKWCNSHEETILVFIKLETSQNFSFFYRC
jgi:hypothetical protein